MTLRAQEAANDGEFESTQAYPIDTDNLVKGSRVTADTIEHAFNTSRDSKNYWKYQMRMRHYIELAFADRNLNVVVRSNGPDLVILTDEEAASFTDVRFQQLIAGAGRMLSKQQAVDRAPLLPATRDRHDRALIVNGGTYAGTKAGRKTAIAALKPKPTKRKTPAKLK